jgi:DNA adenine methylase
MWDNTTAIKPFLRWAGGKTWLLKHIKQITGNIKFNNYHEPFLGGGAVFFSNTLIKIAFLSDLNEELINTYQVIKENPEEVISILKTYDNNEDFYYYLRKEKPIDKKVCAARFIYLNHTSFNGIYRVNKNGDYNVPYGFRNVDYIEEEKIRSASSALQKANIFHGDFIDSLDNIKSGDLVFLDPPYTVSHNNNGFIKYNKTLFSLEDQIRLSKFIDSVKDKGAYYILTNAAHKIILEIFEKGDYCYELSRTSLIGGDKAKRGVVSEYIFTNISGVGLDEFLR